LDASFVENLTADHDERVSGGLGGKGERFLGDWKFALG
jgi:hypothetical protein